MRRFTFHSSMLIALPGFCLLLLTGCGTRFKYQPSHGQSYAPISNNRGIAIIQGEDLRSPDDKHPDWSRKAEAIVADALVDELKHNRIFQRVKIRGSMPKIDDASYSRIVTFRVKKLEYYDDSNALESLGRAALRGHGSEGPWIARSIPAKFVAEAEIEFEVLDAITRRTIFTKTYQETESVRVNAYQSQSPQIHATSQALERVVTRFTADLVGNK